jgi:acyl-CoA thioesterase I
MKDAKFVLKYAVRLVTGMFIWGITTGNSIAEPVKIVGLGDSLMAGYQLEAGQGFPAQLQKALNAKGLDVEVTDAGVSGDTSAGGLARLDWSVPDGTQVVLLELGANDALRGIAPEVTQANLETAIQKLKARKISVILAGMLAPPNMGKTYEDAFNGIFPALAAKHQVPLIPFFLEGVTGKPELQLSDQMHPNPKGVEAMVGNALPVIEKTVNESLPRPSQ